MIVPPKTYAEWAALLRQFSDGATDDDLIHAMQAGTIVWQSGVAERFAQRFSDAVDMRMQRACETFERELARASDDAAIIAALLAHRRRLRFFRAAVDLPVLPADTRQSFIDLVQHMADQEQEALEDSAKSDRSGRMSALVRSHRVNVLVS